VLFQALDDKKRCVGVYCEGRMFYEDLPEDISQTWAYSEFLKDLEIEYASLYTEGKNISELVPEELEQDWHKISSRMKAFIRAFNTSKINLNDVCLFQVVPEAFLYEWCEIKNKICAYIFENYEKPTNYDFLLDLTEITERIKHQRLNIDTTALKRDLASYRSRAFFKKLNSLDPYVHYNVFGTVTGRLTTKAHSFPILTLDKKFRKVLKPNNNLFVELDYNAAELRTFIALNGEEQPQQDLHAWNIDNIFCGFGLDREAAKTRLFAWLYNPNSEDDLLNRRYDRERLLKENWKDGKITTKFGRVIEVDERRALNYIIQSTSSDLFLRQMIKVDKMLEGKKSFIAFSVHDSLVMDFAEEDIHLLEPIIEEFSDTPLGKYLTNVSMGKNYGNMRKIK